MARIRTETGESDDVLREDYFFIEEEILQEENILQVKVPSVGRRFLFRDLTGREIKRIEGLLKGGIHIENSIYILGDLLIDGRGNTYDELTELDFEIFEEVFQSVVQNIVMDIIPWYDFLELAYTFGKKSYSVLPWLMDQEMTLIRDMVHSMESYLKKEEDYMKENNGK